jgi:tetratricopeptide (TPR) repeat protein
MKRFLLLGALLGWFGGGAALAQSNPTSAPASAPTSAPSSLQEAIDLFSAGDFSKAARLFEAAQAAGVRDPLVWYYLGRCREATNETSKAIRAYQQYLKLAPNAPDAPALRLHLSELEAQNPQSGSQPSSQALETEDPPMPEEDTLLYSRQARIGYAATALGGMTSLVGLMLAAVARDREGLIESAPAGTPFDETFQLLQQEGETFNKAFIITSSAGGALLIGGIITALTAPKTVKKDQAQLEVRSWFVPSSSPMLGLTGRW